MRRFFYDVRRFLFAVSSDARRAPTPARAERAFRAGAHRAARGASKGRAGAACALVRTGKRLGTREGMDACSKCRGCAWVSRLMRAPDVWRNRAYQTPVFLAAVCLRVRVDFGMSACRRRASRMRSRNPRPRSRRARDSIVHRERYRRTRDASHAASRRFARAIRAWPTAIVSICDLSGVGGRSAMRAAAPARVALAGRFSAIERARNARDAPAGLHRRNTGIVVARRAVGVSTGRCPSRSDGILTSLMFVRCGFAYKWISAAVRPPREARATHSSKKFEQENSGAPVRMRTSAPTGCRRWRDRSAADALSPHARSDSRSGIVPRLSNERRPSSAIPQARFLVGRPPARIRMQAFGQRSSIFARGAFRNAMIFAARPRIYFHERPMCTCVKFRITPIPARFGERTLFLSGSGAYWAMTSRDFRGGAMGD